MTIMITEVYDALVEAGATDERARKAATAIASRDASTVDGKLTVAMWAGGILFAAILTSQVALWHEMGKLGAGLAQISAQTSHIEQMLRSAGSRP